MLTLRCSQLKLTAPGSQCLKFRTHSSVFLNRFELLTRTLVAKMQNRKSPAVVAPPVVETAPKLEGGEAAAGEAVPGKDDGKAKKKKPKKKK